jgi:hypothetical protein
MDTILEFMSRILPTSEPFISNTTPSTGISITNIDTTTPANNLYPLNCRIIRCPAHKMGKEPLPTTDSNDYRALLQQHGINYHKDLLTSIPIPTLHAIGWFRCNGCNELLFTQPNLTTHNASCQAHQLLERRHKYNNLIQRCPPNHLTELETMIDTNVDGQLITQTFIEWLMEPTIDNLDLL